MNKFDQVKSVLPLKFMFLDCTIVTLRSEALLYMSTPQCPMMSWNMIFCSVGMLYDVILCHIVLDFFFASDGGYPRFHWRRTNQHHRLFLSCIDIIFRVDVKNAFFVVQKFTSFLSHFNQKNMRLSISRVSIVTDNGIKAKDWILSWHKKWC